LGSCPVYAFDSIRSMPFMYCRSTCGIVIEPSAFWFSSMIGISKRTIVEFSFMLDVAEAIAMSALRREESRGAHQRTDFPKRDDQRFLAHSLAFRDADRSCRIEYKPVTITRWPPGERVYGR